MRHRYILSGIALTAAVLVGSGIGWQGATAAEPAPEPTSSAQDATVTDPTTEPSPTVTPTDTAEPVVDVVTINGTGCPLTSDTAFVSEDRNTLVVEYSDFLAESGPGLSAGSHRKNCQMMLDIQAPEGYTYSVSSLNMEGVADLPAGVTALVRTSSYFQGGTASLSLSDTITGPYRDAWEFTQQVPISSKVWQPCGTDGRLLAVNNSVQLTGVTTGTTVASVAVERFSALEIDFARC